MNKHRYKATEVQRVNWSALSDAIKDQRVVFGVDVANVIGDRPQLIRYLRFIAVPA